MGANAQIAVPAFTAGQVLTAAQQTQINTGIPVFATTTTRDAAFGGTGEKVLAQGQTCYIEATSTYQTYNGSSWVTFGSAPGLVTVISETAFSAASTIQVNNCFTSTYTNYLIQFRFTAFSLGSQGVYIRESVSGTPNATNYSFQQFLQSNTTLTGSQNLTDAQHLFGITQTTGAFTTCDVYGPQLAANTNFNSVYGNGVQQQYNSTRHTDTTQYDGFYIFLSGGTMTGTYTVYGYAK
jgi:hypothetical protein